jgi:hypothetical protein
MVKLVEQDFKEAASVIGCEVATIKAVVAVESAGSGFDSKGRPKILFEGHYFYRLTNGKYGKSDISYPKWVKTYYKYDQYDRLDRAAKLDREAALRSTSWGLFQIMGNNFSKCGFSKLQDFINAMYKSEKTQLLAFCNFVKSAGLDDELVRKDWVGFAYGYNGKGYLSNNYHKKLEVAYNKYK